MSTDPGGNAWEKLLHLGEKEEVRRFAVISGHRLAERDTDWMDLSVCSATVAEGIGNFWFSPDSTGVKAERTGARSARIKFAKKLCAECPVIAECLQDALDRNDRNGIWGGLTTYERDKYVANQQATA